MAFKMAAVPSVTPAKEAQEDPLVDLSQLLASLISVQAIVPDPVLSPALEAGVAAAAVALGWRGGLYVPAYVVQPAVVAGGVNAAEISEIGDYVAVRDPAGEAVLDRVVPEPLGVLRGEFCVQ